MSPKPLTVGECYEYQDDLTKEQDDLLRFVCEGSSRAAELHPRITDLRSLRLWLQEGVEENKAFDEAESRADRYHDANR